MLTIVTACSSGPTLPENTPMQVSVNPPKGVTAKDISMLIVSGQLVTATVLQDVRDSAGRVVIAAGDQVQVRAAAVPDSANSGAYRAVASLEEVVIGDRARWTDGSPIYVDWEAGLTVSPTTQDQIAGGAVEGAILGHMLGGHAITGAIIGRAAVGDTQTKLTVRVPCNQALTLPVGGGLPDLPLKPDPKQVSSRKLAGN